MSSGHSIEYHAKELVKHCRVCGKRFPRGARQQKCKVAKALIAQCYKSDIDVNDNTVHPRNLCHACVRQMKRIKAAQGSASLRTTATIFEWTAHTEGRCCMCEHFQMTLRGGCPKKQKPVGRQSGEPTSRTLEALSEAAGVHLAGGVSPSRLASSYIPAVNVVCIICQAVVDAPVQLSCNHLVCDSCIQQQLIDNSPNCPGCRDT